VQNTPFRGIQVVPFKQHFTTKELRQREWLKAAPQQRFQEIVQISHASIEGTDVTFHASQDIKR
jgi:hypothetical protein